MVSICLAGPPIGMLIGFPVGSVLYQFFGREILMVFLATLCAIDGIARVIAKPKILVHKEERMTLKDVKGVLSDVSLMVVYNVSFVSWVQVGQLITFGPAWLIGELYAEQWELGTAVSICVLVSILTYPLVPLIPLPRWIVIVIGQIVLAVAGICYPFSTNIWVSMVPLMILQIGLTFVVAISPALLAHFADLRHNSNYSIMYALFSAVMNLGTVAGTLIGSVLLKLLSFKWMVWISGIYVLIMVPATCLLKRSEKENNKETSKTNGVVASPEKTNKNPDAVYTAVNHNENPA